MMVGWSLGVRKHASRNICIRRHHCLTQLQYHNHISTPIFFVEAHTHTHNQKYLSRITTSTPLHIFYRTMHISMVPAHMPHLWHQHIRSLLNASTKSTLGACTPTWHQYKCQSWSIHLLPLMPLGHEPWHMSNVSAVAASLWGKFAVQATYFSD